MDTEMVKDSKARPTGRRQKQPQTIDAEAKPVSSMDARTDSKPGTETTAGPKSSVPSHPGPKRAETTMSDANEDSSQDTDAKSTGSASDEKPKAQDGQKEAAKPASAADSGSSAISSEAAGTSSSARSSGSGASGSVSNSSPSLKRTGNADAARGTTSMGALLLSAILGGGVALGGAAALNNTSVPVIGGLFGSGSNGDELKAANDRIAELSRRVEALGESAGAGPDSEAVQQALASAQEVAREAGLKADAAANQVSELNERIVESAGGGEIDMEAVRSALSAETIALASRVEALERNATSEGAGGASQAELAAISEEIETMRSSVSGLEGVSATLETVRSQTDELGEKITSTSQAIETIGERIGALETTVNERVLPSMGEVEKAASAALESQRVARSVSARALGAVLEQGGRFTSELASAEALIGESEAVAGLKDLSQNGILTENELLSRFETVSDSILASEVEQGAGDGIVDRFMASARTLVQVRPAGPVEGESTVAIISRIEAALKAGRLQQAQAEWSSLDETAKAASADWADELAERIRAEELIEKVINELSAETGREG